MPERSVRMANRISLSYRASHGLGTRNRRNAWASVQTVLEPYVSPAEAIVLCGMNIIITCGQRSKGVNCKHHSAQLLLCLLIVMIQRKKGPMEKGKGCCTKWK